MTEAYIPIKDDWPTNHFSIPDNEEDQKYHAWFSQTEKNFWKCRKFPDSKHNHRCSAIYLGLNGEHIEITGITTSPFPTISYKDTKYMGVVTKFIKGLYE